MSRYEGLLKVGEELSKTDRKVIIDLGAFDLDAYASARFVATALNAAGVDEKRIDLVYQGPVSHPSSRLAKRWHTGRWHIPYPLKANEDSYKGNPNDAHIFLVDQSGPQSPFVAEEDSPYWNQVVGVIDDHDMYRTLRETIQFVDRSTHHNAASSMCVDYLQEGLVLTDGGLPTILLAGIHTDTNNLRRAKPLDRAASNYLRVNTKIDEDVFEKLSDPKLPPHWNERIRATNKSFERENGYAFGNVGTIHVGDRDLIGVTADALLDREGIMIAAVAGYIRETGKVHCSLRAVNDIPYHTLKGLFAEDDGHIVGGRPTAGVIIQHTRYDGEADTIQHSLDEWMENVRDKFTYLKTHGGTFA